MVKEWDESNFKTGLVLHVGDDLKTIKRKPYQKFLNEQLREKAYFEKPSKLRREKKNLAILRNKYKVEKEQKNH